MTKPRPEPMRGAASQAAAAVAGDAAPILGRIKGIRSYLAKLKQSSPQPARTAKAQFSGLLRAADDAPQIISVQGRNGRRTTSYMLIPADVGVTLAEAAAALDTRIESPSLVERLREIDGGRPLQRIAPSAAAAVEVWHPSTLIIPTIHRPEPA